MKLEPDQIPQSFQGYIDQFDDDPETAISRLEQHVDRRNTGAAGYFFLAWLCHRNGDRQKAIQYAFQAKTHAPGSRLMDHLPYLLTHPQTFAAWEPALQYTQTFNRDNFRNDRGHPIQDLDSLIDKLSSVENKRIRPDTSTKEYPDLSQPSTLVDDIVTETLAVIHEKQNNFPAAIQTYKKLRQANPAKRDHYDEQILRLQEKQSAEEKSDK
jgi:tetratricopeptide (TPR) repeat protein